MTPHLLLSCQIWFVKSLWNIGTPIAPACNLFETKKGRNLWWSSISIRRVEKVVTVACVSLDNQLRHYFHFFTIIFVSSLCGPHLHAFVVPVVSSQLQKQLPFDVVWEFLLHAMCTSMGHKNLNIATQATLKFKIETQKSEQGNFCCCYSMYKSKIYS